MRGELPHYRLPGTGGRRNENGTTTLKRCTGLKLEGIEWEIEVRLERFKVWRMECGAFLESRIPFGW
jgi:hypothetical protein